MAPVFLAIPFTNATFVRVDGDRMPSRVMGVRLAVAVGIGSAAHPTADTPLNRVSPPD